MKREGWLCQRKRLEMKSEKWDLGTWESRTRMDLTLCAGTREPGDGVRNAEMLHASPLQQDRRFWLSLKKCTGENRPLASIDGLND